MTIRALNVAVTGMQAQERAIANIANNISNANTTAFKSGFLTTVDLAYQTERRVGGPVSGEGGGSVVPTGVQFGTGTAVNAIVKNFKQGNFSPTSQELNFAIDGRGFFAVTLPDGTQAYTRDGNFRTDPNTNQLVTSLGYVVLPGITIDEKREKVEVNSNGKVSIKLQGNPTLQEVGQFQLMTFPNEGGLEAIGDNLYMETDGSGAPVEGSPGVDNVGTIKQSWLETSNVDPITEMTDLIKGQRIYEMISKVLHVGDQMLKNVSEIKA
ncbi:Flagellar basal-body rod protein FlgG [Alphaproteobacteria bacterium]